MRNVKSDVAFFIGNDSKDENLIDIPNASMSPDIEENDTNRMTNGINNTPDIGKADKNYKKGNDNWLILDVCFYPVKSGEKGWGSVSRFWGGVESGQEQHRWGDHGQWNQRAGGLRINCFDHNGVIWYPRLKSCCQLPLPKSSQICWRPWSPRR